uniref:ATP synthase F0 subunit 8 n=1 Tax=Lipotactes tripyrga TaxID=948390 RepID=A0A1Q1MPW7_9ORTH|nr:ATP synthase F0 subunit 8 [Lipotactes tripyrga]AQM40125.1 ATP synthase F0 subunit 8 [Lipotactes tripyrga]
MPQMSPMNWLTLFLMFTGTLIMFSFMNYFTMYSYPLYNKSTKDQCIFMFNWKW